MYTSDTQEIDMGGKIMEFSITKRIAKHGTQSIIILPKDLSEMLSPCDLVEVKIKLIKKGGVLQ